MHWFVNMIWMMRLHNTLLRQVLNVVIILVPFLAAAQPSDSTQVKLTKQELIKEKQKIQAEIILLNEAIQQSEHTISIYKKSDFTPTTMFQLSQLYVKREKLAYILKMEVFERQLALFDKGILQAEPEEPRVEYGPSIQLCDQVFKRFPDNNFKESLLYWHGLCLFEDNEREQASQVFKQLLAEFPETQFKDEVNFRIGEHYFDMQEYQQAIDVYKLTIKKWDNSFFGMALYKLAWSYYKINDYQESISTFFYLLRDLDMLDTLNCEEMGRSKLDLRDETIDYLAICFSELGGLTVAQKFLSDINGTPNQVVKITHHLGDVYRKRSFYEEALAIYHDLLKKYPLYPAAPTVQFAIFDCYNKMENQRQAIATRNILLKNYHPKSKWGLANNKAEDRDLLKDVIVKVDFILATPLLAKADEALRRDDKEKAIKHYKDFIQNFSRDERAPRAAFNIAECYYDLKNYRSAARMYQVVVKKFPPHEFTEDAAYNRVICFDQLFTNETDPMPDKIKLTVGRKKTEIPVKSKAQKALLQACHEFVRIIPSGDKTVEILLKSIGEFVNLERYDVAQGLLHRVIQEITRKNHGTKFYSQAASLMAQVSYKQEKFKKAEKWYAIVAKTAGDSVKDSSRKMMASSRYKIAENLMAQGDSLKAAREFERIALRYSGSDVAEVATYDAALQYEKAGFDLNAAKLFELFGRRYPKSEYIEEALFHAGVLYEKHGHYKKAAQNFMKVYLRDKTSKLAADALYSAGSAYEAAEKWRLAASAYGKFLKEFKAEPVKLFETAFREALATYKNKNYVSAKQLLHNTLQYYHSLVTKNIEVDSYYAAQASFLLAEIDFVYFSFVKITPPLEAAMHKKQLVLNVLLQKYLETTKYKVADWTTAAFFKIGQAFEKFGQAILESPAPENASEEELKLYWDTIQSKLVHPLLAKALEYYLSNEKLAEKADIENEWVEQSRQRIAELKNELSIASHAHSTKIAN